MTPISLSVTAIPLAFLSMSLMAYSCSTQARELAGTGPLAARRYDLFVVAVLLLGSVHHGILTLTNLFNEVIVFLAVPLQDRFVRFLEFGGGHCNHAEKEI